MDDYLPDIEVEYNDDLFCGLVLSRKLCSTLSSRLGTCADLGAADKSAF